MTSDAVTKRNTEGLDWLGQCSSAPRTTPSLTDVQNNPAVLPCPPSPAARTVRWGVGDARVSTKMTSTTSSAITPPSGQTCGEQPADQRPGRQPDRTR